MPNEDKNIGGSSVLNLRIWWRHVKTLHIAREFRGNASRTGAYLPLLRKAAESASRKKSAGGFSF